MKDEHIKTLAQIYRVFAKKVALEGREVFIPSPTIPNSGYRPEVFADAVEARDPLVQPYIDKIDNTVSDVDIFLKHYAESLGVELPPPRPRPS